jgi:hypothetical protein
MASKRPREDEADAPQPKKPRTGFKVGPDNLPDGTWKRKVIKIKKNLIYKAKVKKSYAKLKAREPLVDKPIPDEVLADVQAAARLPPQPSQELHPERQAMLDAPREPTPPLRTFQARSDRKRSCKPAYFEKETAFAEQKKAEAEARRLEFERRDRERKQKIAERERFRKTMAKARTGGKNGQRKLGRESKVLLEKVWRVVGSSE